MAEAFSAGNSQLVSNTQVIDATTLLATPSQPHKSEGIKAGLIGKFPVVIAETKVQIYVEAQIALDQPALEIKGNKRNLFLNQYELMQTDDKKGSKLIISGYVRDNIEYSTASKVSRNAINGEICHTTLNVPFSCFTKIDIETSPQSYSNDPAVESLDFDPTALGANRLQQNYISSERYNEKIYCELVDAKIYGLNIVNNPVSIAQNSNEFTFDTFTERMVIDVTVKLLQNQQVQIPAYSGGNDGGKGGSNSSGKSDSKGGGNDGGKSGGNGGGKNESKGGGKDEGKGGGKDEGKGGGKGEENGSQKHSMRKQFMALFKWLFWKW
jgi:hypothetical protein